VSGDDGGGVGSRVGELMLTSAQGTNNVFRVCFRMPSEGEASARTETPR